MVANRCAAPQQLRANRERGERKEEQPGRAAPAEPGEQCHQRAGDDQRSEGLGPGEVRQRGHDAGAGC